MESLRSVCDGVSALLVQIARINRLEGERVLKEAGIRTGQEFVLGALWEADGQRPSDIASRLGVTAAVLTKHVHNLTRAGFLTTRPDEQDGRATRIFLTAKGRDARDAVSAGIRDLEVDLLRPLDAADREAFARMLAKLVAAKRDQAERP